MRLREFYEPKNDQAQQISANDTRKARLTLKELNKLRKYRDIKQAEEDDYLKLVRVMYRAPSGDSGPGF